MAARAEPAPWVDRGRRVPSARRDGPGECRARGAICSTRGHARAPRRPRDRSAARRHIRLASRACGRAAARRARARRAPARRARALRWRAPCSPRDRSARVVVNGGNCAWPDINWLHAVHAAWPVRDDGAPWWSRYRTRRLKRIADRARARRPSAGRALVIANSEATRRAAIDRVGVARARAHTVYLGSDPEWGVPARRGAGRGARRTGAAAGCARGAVRRRARQRHQQGIRLLWRAWRSLSRSGQWDARLVVAGGGWRAAAWQREAERSHPPGHVALPRLHAAHPRGAGGRRSARQPRRATRPTASTCTKRCAAAWR